jgi:hypothetical protein
MCWIFQQKESSGAAGVLTSRQFYNAFPQSLSLKPIFFFKRAGFSSIGNFREFCKLSDVDPEASQRWERYRRCPNSVFYGPGDQFERYVWLSRTKDIVIETSCNPLQQEGYCHYFSLHGRVDKAILMFNFM